MSVVNFILRIQNIIEDVIRKRDVKEKLKIVENPLIWREERPTPRIVLVIFLFAVCKSIYHWAKQCPEKR